jgi:plasmid replication initiation protein
MLKMGRTKGLTKRRRTKSVIRKGLPESLPTSVQKSYFMLSDAERNVLNIGLQKYRPGQSEPILVGGEKMLKAALRLMSDYRLRIDEIKEDVVVTSYTRWLESVRARGAENSAIYLTFSPQFEHIWLESKKRLPEYVSQKPANLGLRSQYSIRLYSWARKYASVGTKRILLDDLRKVLGLQSVKDADGKIIQEAPLPIWANFRQRALDVAILEITKKTDLKIAIESLERSKHRRIIFVTFSIQEQAAPEGD